MRKRGEKRGEMAAIDGRGGDTKRENEGVEEGETERAAKYGRGEDTKRENEGDEEGDMERAAIHGRGGDTKRENEGGEEEGMGRAAKDGRDGDKRRREERGRKGDGKRVAKGEQRNKKRLQRAAICFRPLQPGRDDPIRTGDLAPPRRVLYQLSYIPIFALSFDFAGAKIGYCFDSSKFFM